jgi:hypothetical protein
MSLMADALEIALAEIGVLEDPPNSNRGPRVEEYLRSVDMAPGLNWCAAFTSWCLLQAGGKPGITHPHGAWTPSCWAWGVERQLAFTSTDVRDGLVTREDWAGALFFMRGTRTGETEERINHVGFVRELGPSVRTVEGNIRTGGKRGVWSIGRPLESVAGFVVYGEFLAEA